MGSLSVPPKGSAAGQPAPSPMMSFAPLIVVVVIMYFLVIRPQQKAAKDHRKMVDNLKNGDRVLTQGGIYGTVTGIKGGIVQVKIADNVKIDISRSAVTQVLVEGANGVQPAVTGDKNS